jgi:hypothetical protein
MLSTWKGSDYLADLTKTDALIFKDYALRKGHIGSSVKNIIGFLSGFWNWGKDNQIIKENLWEGLKKDYLIQLRESCQIEVFLFLLLKKLKQLLLIEKKKIMHS